MSIQQPEEEVMILKGQIKLPYQWTVGVTGSRFLTDLRDRKQIWGTKCPKCEKVYVVPRKNCPECFSIMGEWVEVSPKGTLQTFTIVHNHVPALHPMETPFAYGIIKLDEADTGIVHYLGGVDFSGIRSGMRVEAVFNEQREGSLLDIKYFRPISI